VRRCLVTIGFVSSDGDNLDALENLRRELRAIQQQDPAEETTDGPPVAELEALAETLGKLKAAGPVPFDRERTWASIQEQIAPDKSTEDA